MPWKANYAAFATKISPFGCGESRQQCDETFKASGFAKSIS
jgi:hypothetical protein